MKAVDCAHVPDLQISGVVWMFRYPPGTALAVGLSMAQIGEFAFVLLSVASQLGLMPHQVYMLLMGTHFTCEMWKYYHSISSSPFPAGWG